MFTGITQLVKTEINLTKNHNNHLMALYPGQPGELIPEGRLQQHATDVLILHYQRAPGDSRQRGGYKTAVPLPA